MKQEENIPHLMYKELTAKENRKNVIKVILQALAFVVLGFVFMYASLDFILWLDAIGRKLHNFVNIVGLS